jgi:serine/threonine protein phosphatase PrpC
MVRTRSAAVRYVNKEAADNDKLLVKANRTLHVDVSGIRGGALAVAVGVQGWRKTMEDAHVVWVSDPASGAPSHGGGGGGAADSDTSMRVLRSFECGHLATEPGAAHAATAAVAGPAAPEESLGAWNMNSSLSRCTVDIDLFAPFELLPNQPRHHRANGQHQHSAFEQQQQPQQQLDANQNAGHDAESANGVTAPAAAAAAVAADDASSSSATPSPTDSNASPTAAARAQALVNATADPGAVTLELDALAAGTGVEAFVGVFDGHATDAVSAFLASHLPPAIVRALRGVDASALGNATSDATAALQAAFDAAFAACDAEVRRLSPLVHGGSTAAGAVVLRDVVILFSVGDCRCAVFEVREVPAGNGAAAPAAAPDNGASPPPPRIALVGKLDDDHRPGGSNAAETARLERVGAPVSNNRLGGKLSVTRAFGDFEFKAEGAAAADQHCSCLPDLRLVPRRPGTDLLITIGCDGVFETQQLDGVGALVHSCANPIVGAVRVAQRSVSSTQPLDERGGLLPGSDNVTFVALTVPGRAAAAAAGVALSQPSVVGGSSREPFGAGASSPPPPAQAQSSSSSSAPTAAAAATAAPRSPGSDGKTGEMRAAFDAPSTTATQTRPPVMSPPNAVNKLTSSPPTTPPLVAVTPTVKQRTCC